MIPDSAGAGLNACDPTLALSRDHGAGPVDSREARVTRGHSILSALLAVPSSGAAACLVMCGCGDDESAKPVESVSLSIDSTGVSACQLLDILAEVAGGETRTVTWLIMKHIGLDSMIFR